MSSLKSNNSGFDFNLVRYVSEMMTMPVIANGGCGSKEHLKKIITGDIEFNYKFSKNKITHCNLWFSSAWSSNADASAQCVGSLAASFLMSLF